MRASVLGATIALTLLPACLGSLPKPPGGPVPADALVEVSYPPPAARTEVVPATTRAGDVWIDGQWDWDGTVWKWLPGVWMKAPPNAYFTPWETKRRSDGRLFFARAAWRGKDGRALDQGFGRDACPVPPAAGSTTQ